MDKKEYQFVEDAVRHRGMNTLFDDTFKHIKDPKFIKILNELHAVYTKMDKYLEQTQKRVNNGS